MSAVLHARAVTARRVVDVDAHEGPVYFADEDALYFTALPAADGRVQIKRLALDGSRFPLELDRVSVVVQDANGANGMAHDGEGRLLVCEQGGLDAPARISRADRSSGRRDTVVSEWRGLRFNSPNDVVAASDGAVWFTDPSYGHLQGFRPEPVLGDYVYRHDPVSSETDVVADGFNKPNGIAFSPDGSVLYVTDSGANQKPGSYYPARPHHIKAFDVLNGRKLTGERLFAVVTPGFPDGLKVDATGRVYASSFSGVQIFSPLGEHLGEIALPGAVNFCFGGAEDDLLFITTDSAIWVVELPTP
ncbi:MAG: SMP-30/gluconolactonase/LRE family protein [Solirubrobacteraceae bacterium]